MKFVLVLLSVAVLASGNAKAEGWAVEADAAAYALSGYSLIARKTFASGFDIALGGGSYQLPGFILKTEQRDDNADNWEARAKAIYVLRIGYRFDKPSEDGLALHVISMWQNWRVQSSSLGGRVDFSTFSSGLSAGYYFHFGSHFYVYPTAAFVGTARTRGTNTLSGTDYKITSAGVNGSVHAGYEF